MKKQYEHAITKEHEEKSAKKIIPEKHKKEEMVR